MVCVGEDMSGVCVGEDMSGVCGAEFVDLI